MQLLETDGINTVPSFKTLPNKEIYSSLFVFNVENSAPIQYFLISHRDRLTDNLFRIRYPKMPLTRVRFQGYP